jgi:dipeptidyl aminopeptidase/acylaminoacyl peptidase
MLGRTFGATLLLFATPFFAGAAVPRTVGEDDYALYVRLAAPAISPDGKLAALVVSRTVWNEDRWNASLVAVDVATGAQRTLIANGKGLSDPAFSPDGAYLAFLAQNDETTQVFTMATEAGEARAISRSATDVEDFAWRPDGHAIVYAAADAQPERTGADRFRNSFVFTTEPIVARSRPQPLHLYLLDLDRQTSTQLTFGAESVCDGSSISWSPDATTIAFTLCRNAILNDQSYSHVAVLDVASKSVRSLTGRTMWEGGPLFSPDGKYIAYEYSDGDPQVNLTQLFVTTPSGGAGTPLGLSLDRPIGDAVWAHDSRSLIVTAPDRTTNAVYRVPLMGAPGRLDLGTVVPGIPMSTTGGAESPALGKALAADGTFVFVGSATKAPPELYRYLPDGGISKLTDFNVSLAQFVWGNGEAIAFPTSTGVTADGVLYYPPDFSAGRKYPLVVFIHGGPDDPSMLCFDFWSQVMAARGWLVLRPNYRGTPNLGIRYQRAILYDPEDGPGKDIMSALRAVRARGIVDDSRLAVSGWSYGGIMTAWMISKYHSWKAAVSGASVNDWITDYGTADDSLADADLFHGSPFVKNNAAEWRRASAISYAHDVNTPVLILSDIGDNRDPFATSSMYWRALRDNGKIATLRVWPVPGHFPNDPVRIADIYHYWIDFIAQYFR